MQMVFKNFVFQSPIGPFNGETQGLNNLTAYKAADAGAAGDAAGVCQTLPASPHHAVAQLDHFLCSLSFTSLKLSPA